jgi:ribosomal protein L11 methyltransferase
VRWLEVSLTVTGELAEPVADLLARHVPGGVALEAERGESGAAPAPGDVVVRAFLPLDDRVAAQRTQIEEGLWHLGQIAPLPRPAYREIAEQDWAEAWKTHYHPIPVGRRLLVLPAWLPVPQGDRLPLILDPGMAFGTGTHPSTQMCLRALDERIPAFHRQPSFLDVGTGSGILAIAAWKLGAKPVMAIDIDPVAVESARKNAKANKAAKEIAFHVGSLDGRKQGFDMVAANLLPQELLRLASPLSRMISPGGVAIVSGFLRSQKKEIAEAFGQYHLQVGLTRNSKGWACFELGHKKREK